jgi:hypothetical protein
VEDIRGTRESASRFVCGNEWRSGRIPEIPQTALFKCPIYAFGQFHERIRDNGPLQFREDLSHRQLAILQYLLSAGLRGFLPGLV